MQLCIPINSWLLTKMLGINNGILVSRHHPLYNSSCWWVDRNLCQTVEEDPSREKMLQLLEELYNKQPRLGYYFLYFLKVR